MLSASRSEVSGEVPGLRVGGDRHRHADACAGARPAAPGSRAEIIGARQQDRGDARARHRRHARFVGIFEMVGRQRAEFCGKRAAAVRLESWSACSLTGRPEPSRGVENTRDFRWREARSPRRRRRRRRPALRRASAGIILVRRPGRYRRRGRREFGRQRMGGEQRRANRDRRLSARRRATRSDFRSASSVKPIAGFDLDRRHALGDQGVEARAAPERISRPRSPRAWPAWSRGCRRRRGRSLHRSRPRAASRIRRARSPP